MNPNIADTPVVNGPESSNATSSESTSTDLPMRERERRASRMLAQLREGFRRSASSRSVPALAGPSKVPLDANASGQEMMGMTLDGREGQQEGIQTAQASDGVRQDKKRRRIGEYAGPSEAMVADGVEDLSVDATSADLAASTSNSLEKVTSPPLLSPGLVPLTDSDPLLDDRLRTVEAIRSVLGDDVARRLPSVESLRELTRTHAIVEDESPTTPVETTSSGQADTRSLRRSSRISLPPSTVELLDRLERSSQNPDATEEHTIASTSPIEGDFLPASQTTTEPPTGPSTMREERRARRTSIRNFTNRLSGWLGVGASRNEKTRGEAVPADTSQPEPRPATSTSLPDNGDPTNRVETPAQEEAPAAPNRLATGAVMIVQGFVQTTIPVRERRRRPATENASSRNQNQPQTSTSGLAPRRTMSQPGRSAASSFRPGPLSSNATSQMPMRDPVVPVVGISTVDDTTSHMAGHAPRGETDASQNQDNGGVAQSQDASSASSGREPSHLPFLEAPLPANTNPNSIRSSLRSATRPQQQSARQQPDPAASVRSTEPDSRPEPPSFAEQARMLGGLLSVATAATATSLLSHGNPANTSNEAQTGSQLPHTRVSGPRAALEALRNRLRASSRPSGPTADARGTEDAGNAAANRGVEDVLREYMRHAMASSRNASRLSDGDGSDRPPALSTLLPTSDPASFEAFLNNMQTSLIEALSAFVEESDAELERGSNGGNTAEDATPSSPSADPSAAAEDAPPAAPSVSADESVQPRRLNFFRLFQFPPRQTTSENPSDPAVDLIPVVIVGVRSMSGDINSLTAQNVAAAPFPFNPTDDIQGSTPAQEGAPATDERIDDGSRSTPAATQRARSEEADPRPPGSWPGRAMRSISRLRRPRNALTNTEATESDDAFTRNYVLWVVGGNYPAGHPILTIPHLFTGELTHEDLWVLAEALGQAKPPVATRTDIENSGLAIIKSHQVRGEGDSGAILASSVDQCLICLGDFEDELEIDVRVMKCRHAYHKDCIDHWLEVGRNSCPACRQAGVERASDRPPEPAAAETAQGAEDEDVNMTS